MNKRIMLSVIVLAVISLLVLSILIEAGSETKRAEIGEGNVTIGYILGKPVYSEYREIIVNSSGVFYFSLDSLIQSGNTLKNLGYPSFSIRFEAQGNLVPNERFQFRRTLIIDTTKNITGLTILGGKFLYYEIGNLAEKAPSWVSCEVRLTGDGVEKMAKCVDEEGVVEWDGGFVKLPPGVYKIEVEIFGVPEDRIEEAKFVVLLDAKCDVPESVLYNLTYGFEENTTELSENFDSLNNWNIRSEDRGEAYIVKEFEGRSGVLLLANSVVKYSHAIKIKPPFRIDVGTFIPQASYGSFGIGGDKCDLLTIDFDTEGSYLYKKNYLSLYLNTLYLNETHVEECEKGLHCWDRIDTEISTGWHDISVVVDQDGNVSMFIDGEFAGKLKLRLKGLNGEMRIFESSVQGNKLGVDYIRIYKMNGS